MGVSLAPVAAMRYRMAAVLSKLVENVVEQGGVTCGLGRRREAKS